MSKVPLRSAVALAGVRSSAADVSVTARSLGHHRLISAVHPGIAPGGHSSRWGPFRPRLSRRCSRWESMVSRLPAPTRSATMAPTPARCLPASHSTPARWWRCRIRQGNSAAAAAAAATSAAMPGANATASGAGAAATTAAALANSRAASASPVAPPSAVSRLRSGLVRPEAASSRRWSAPDLEWSCGECKKGAKPPQRHAAIAECARVPTMRPSHPSPPPSKSTAALRCPCAYPPVPVAPLTPAPALAPAPAPTLTPALAPAPASPPRA
mmetsp:Transcript_23705/g.58758  ORF Transcript_23705/g.58758 Transcript_23705/m.58758 type:complete len:270 (-) Transcript_23705:222-1031(-)